MPKSIQAAMVLTVAVLTLTGAGGCGSKDLPADQAPAEQSSTQPAASATREAADPLRARVHEYAARMMADIKAAEDRGDVIDGVPVGQSSNPYDYVGVSPMFVKIVGLGEEALPAIADEILGSKQDGLREYLLAAAGAQISGDVPGSGAQTWDTGKAWAQRYRATL